MEVPDFVENCRSCLTKPAHVGRQCPSTSGEKKVVLLTEMRDAAKFIKVFGTAPTSDSMRSPYTLRDNL